MNVDQGKSVDSTTDSVPQDDRQTNAPPLNRRSPFPEDTDILDESTQRQRAGLRWIVGSGLVLIVGVGGWFAYQTFWRQPPTPVEVITAPVTRSDLEDPITEAGVVELGGQQTFKAPGDVTVQAVLV
ncbi:MAG: hypothetical protein F6K42_25495, partial [Leptolyngbya sp. SIO1D8]|nr:hypothetical protein [Leptolyngbya sp. SIO1D8]